MALVEAVISKLLQLRPKRLSHLTRRSTDLHCSFDKLRLNLLHQVDLFLTNGLAQGIGLSTSKAAPLLGDLHKLLLIDQNTIRVLK